MPDKAGTFLAAVKVFMELGLNITRVSYNKAVDTHMLFIEAEGAEALLDAAADRLRKMNYLLSAMDAGDVILLEFRLKDVPGSVLPVLELINSFSFNISYISSQSDGSGYQQFRMGLFTENNADISDFIRRVSSLCEVRIIDYNETENVLDNTVFYISFVNSIADKLRLDNEQKIKLLLNSNLIMELLNKSSKPPHKTFEYIGLFADKLYEYRGESFSPRISEYSPDESTLITLIEPPCGSNICLIRTSDGILAVDGGFRLYADETAVCIKKLVPDFECVKKSMLLTHADVDHCGIADCFDEIILNRKMYDNFASEVAGEDNIREKNPLHSPYIRISKLLSAYRTPELSKMRIFGGSGDKLNGLTEYIGIINVYGLELEAYEGCGGHVAGEMIYVERRLRLVFTGDVFVNIKGFSREQAQFNRLAPYLMSSVDTDPAAAAREREAVFALLGAGEWTLFCGHGQMKKITL